MRSQTQHEPIMSLDTLMAYDDIHKRVNVSPGVLPEKLSRGVRPASQNPLGPHPYKGVAPPPPPPPRGIIPSVLNSSPQCYAFNS